MTKQQKNVFMQSLRRCKEKEDFIDQFYRRFLGASDEIKQMFEHTNFAAQKFKLLKSLEIIVLAIEGIPEAVHQLNLRAISHSREHLNVKPELYDYWLESLLQTVVVCDHQYNQEVEHAWREAGSYAIKYMTDRY